MSYINYTGTQKEKETHLNSACEPCFRMYSDALNPKLKPK